jgi:outer membrane protein assembly factor BamB
VPEVSSPVVYDGKLYTVTLNGIMSCYDAHTGELKWRQRLPRGQYFSSLVAGDGKVYASSETGVTSVVAATSEFKMLAQNDLAEEIYASPAIADGCLLIRTTKSLYCIARDAARTFARSSR